MHEDRALNTLQKDNGVEIRAPETSKPTSKKSRPRTLDEACFELNTKVENKRSKRSQSIEDTLEWLSDPIFFFGCRTFDSIEQWSFFELIDLEKKNDLARASLHMAHLAYFLERYIELSRSKNPPRSCMKAMFHLVQPDFNELSRKEKENRQKWFRRFIKQGQVLLWLARKNAGLLINLGPDLTGDEYVFQISPS
jgi:hypothetical protein